MKDYYAILGLNKNASPEDIKKKFRALSKRYHPDKTTDPEEKKSLELKFQEISEAYTTLSDPQRRKKYDNPGMRMGFDPFSRFSGNPHFGHNPVFTNIPSQRPLSIDIHLDVEELCQSHKRKVNYMRNEYCDVCAGHGYASKNGVSACSFCGGTGRVSHAAGFINLSAVCGNCQGRGFVISDPCKGCEGKGMKEVPGEVNINIPRGLKDNSMLRVPGAGHYDSNMKTHSDLYVRISVNRHKFFDVSDFPHVNCIVPITLIQAMSGGTIEVPTVDGVAKLTIPSGTQPGSVFRMAKQGLHSSPDGNYRGDQNVRIDVEIPKMNDHLKNVADIMSTGPIEHPRVSKYLELLQEVRRDK